MRRPPLGRIFFFVAHLLACVALAPVAQAVCPAPSAGATYVASDSFTARWSSSSFATSYGLDVSTSSSFSTYVPGYQNLNVGNVTRHSVTGLDPSTTYYFRVHRYCPHARPPFSISSTVQVTTLSPTGRPVAITNPATYIASYSARLEGTVDPHGLTTTVYFQYGTTISYGLTSAIQSKTGDNYQNVAATISGLTASTTYHFRILATNSAGTRYGVDQTFTTLSATGPPVVITSAATKVTSSSATLNGSVDPHGLTTNVHFQYGTTTSYGLTTANQTKTGDAYQNVAANISGLSARTTYHFRIVGTNTSGTTYGSDTTFTIDDDLISVSTRADVLTGDNATIMGFTVNQSQRILVRAFGPTLQNFGLTGVLADPTIQLFNSSSALVASNDNWKDTNQAAIAASGYAPPNDLESAILLTLTPGKYTAVVRGKNNTTGVALVEAYALDFQMTVNTLTNVSARGFVGTSDQVMIGGFIGGGIRTILVRVLGPTLAQYGVPNVLQDPTLELHDGNGNILAVNDNWQDTQKDQIQATGLAPPNLAESAILIGIAQDFAVTAVVRGKNNTTGVALFEAYVLP